MFHVNEAGKPKVWCDSDVSRIYPGMLGQGT